MMMVEGRLVIPPDSSDKLGRNNRWRGLSRVICGYCGSVALNLFSTKTLCLKKFEVTFMRQYVTHLYWGARARRELHA